MQDLQCYEPIVLAILGEINRGHSAAAELAVDCVCLRQRAAKAIEGQRQFALTCLAGSP